MVIDVTLVSDHAKRSMFEKKRKLVAKGEGGQKHDAYF